MISSLVGCLQGPEKEYGHENRLAAAIDFTGFVTMVVLGVLAIYGHLSIGYTGGCLLALGGGIGLILFMVKNVKNANNVAS